MSDVILVSAEWLMLREDADARSRSRRLAHAVARQVHQPIVVHDLGSGTGSMMRWLGPLLPGAQTWVLHDWNPALLEHAAADPVRDASGGRVGVVTSVEHVEQLRPDDLTGATLVTASALLDVLTREEVGAIVRSCIAAEAPALFSLSATGRVRIVPADPGDRVFEAAFNDHQRRIADGRRLLGPDAASHAADLFVRAGWAVRFAGSAWRLGTGDRALMSEWIGGWVAAAVEQRPALREWADEYLRTRTDQLDRGELRIAVHHADILAWPR